MKKKNMSKAQILSIIFAGIFLLILYFSTAILFRNFPEPELDYHRIFGTFIAWITFAEVNSQLWKLILLFPATVLISIGIAKLNVKLTFFKEIRHSTLLISMVIISILVLTLSIGLLFHETEITDDENTYDFQAQTLMNGRVVNPPPPVHDSFTNIFIINDNLHWVGKYNLGHPLIIALGMILGNRYIFIVIMSSLLILFVYKIGIELFNNNKIALLAAALIFVSPFYFFMSSSRLSHTSCTFFLSFFMYLFLHERKEVNSYKNIILSFCAGLALGFAFTVRQYTTFAFALPFLFLFAYDVWKSPKKVFVSGLPLAIGFLLFFASVLWYNKLVTGNPLKFPFSYYNPAEKIGFGTFGHSVMGGFRNLTASIFRMDIWLFGFAPSLIFIFIMIFVKKRFSDLLLFSIVGSIIISYFFYFSPGIADLGPAYYFETIVPLVLLSARGFFYLTDSSNFLFLGGKKFAYTFLTISILMSLINFYPERIKHVESLIEQINEPYKTIKKSNIHNAIVLIKPFEPRGWVYGIKNPSPIFNDDVIYCKFADSLSNRNIVNYFSGRKPYVLFYSSNSGFELKPFIFSN
jgi:hypothetical protein